MKNVDGVLKVTSTGGDPYLIPRDAPRAEIRTIRLRMKSTSAGPAQLFWLTAQHKQFFRDRSVRLDVTHDGQWRTYEVDLPENVRMTGFRIDPSTAPGEIEIDWIQLISPREKIAKIWGFDG